MDTEENILAAIYINLVNMGAFTNLQIDLSFLQEIVTSKKDIRNILLFHTALLANDKYEVAKRKAVVGYNSRRGQACKFIKKEAQVLSCEFCEIFKNISFTEHLWTAASMTH